MAKYWPELQHQNLEQTLCSKSEQKFGFITKLQLPSMHQTVANTILIINISNSNNIKKFWVGIFTRQDYIKIFVWPCDMTSRSYFGKMNSTLGSVVPLAMFAVLNPGDQQLQLTLFKPKIYCTMIMGISQRATSARQEWIKWQSNSRKKPDYMFCLLYSPLTQMDCSIFCFVWVFASLDI